MNTPGSSRYTSPTSPRAKQTSPRKTHRRRVSAVRLSSDTTSTLPEYNPHQPPASSALIGLDQRQAQTRALWESSQVVEESDLPPRYEDQDSAEEADEDTDDERHRFSSSGALRRELIYSHPATRSTPSLMSSANSNGPRYPSTLGYTYPHSSRTKRGPSFEHQQHRHHRSVGSRDSLSSFASSSSSRNTHYSRPSRSSRSHHAHHSSQFRDVLYRQDESAEEQQDDETREDRDQDDFLDSLLQRSVQALEMSNVLMQSSISTRDSVETMVRGGSRNPSPGPSSHSPAARYSQLSSPLAPSPRTRHPNQGYHRAHRPTASYDYHYPVDYDLEGPHDRQDLFRDTRHYESRRWDRDMNDIHEEPNDDIRDVFAGPSSARTYSDTRARRKPVWEDDLDEIKRTLDAWALSGEDQHLSARSSRSSSGHIQESSLSSSLPVQSSMPARDHQPPSVDPRGVAAVVTQDEPDTPQLRLSFKGRDQLVSRPPRALTQYISTDPDEIVLPSTLGLRAGCHSWKAASTTTLNIQSPVITPSLDPPQSHPTFTSIFPRSIATAVSPSHAANSSSAYDVLSSIASPIPSSSTPGAATSSSFLSPLTSPRLSVSTFTRPFRRRASTGMKGTSLDKHSSPADLGRSHSQQASSSSASYTRGGRPAVRSSRNSATSRSSDSPSRSPSYSRSHSQSRNTKNLTINTLPHHSSTSSTTFTGSSPGQHSTQPESPVASTDSRSNGVLSLSSSPGSSNTSSSTTLILHCGSRTLAIPPPIQELSSPSPSEPSSESDGCPAKLTIKSLRKILEDQQAASAAASSLDLVAGQNSRPSKLKPPQFMPSGADGKKSGMSGVSEPRISTATASVSRLLTKNTHSSSTKPPDPPRVSVLKKSAPPTPTSSSGLATPTLEENAMGHGEDSARPSQSTHLPQLSLPTLNLPSLRLPSFSMNNSATSSPGSSIQGTGHSIFITNSTPASGTSTPKRISFAEPLEGTLSSSSSRFKARKQASSSSSRRKRRSSSLSHMSSSSRRTDEEELIDGMPWWTRWLFSAAAVGNGVQSPATGISGAGAGFHSGHGADERSGAMRWGTAGRVDDWGY
jgi:hypothetical protein